MRSLILTRVVFKKSKLKLPQDGSAAYHGGNVNAHFKVSLPYNYNLCLHISKLIVNANPYDKVTGCLSVCQVFLCLYLRISLTAEPIGLTG